MDWTDILVALIGLLGTVLTVVITHCLKTYVNPWLEQHWASTFQPSASIFSRASCHLSSPV